MDYKNIIKKQRDFFLSGKTKEYNFRLEALKSLKEAMLYYEKDVYDALKKDLNKSTFETFISEYGITLQEITHATKKLKSWMKTKRKATGIGVFPGRAYEISEPYGVTLIISPWNYPIQLALSPLIGAIAAGNCVIIKPSEFSTASSDIIEKIITKAFNEEYIKVVQGDALETELLLKERFDYIFFTGSTNVGKIIMSAASKHLTPVTLELGGKSPCIVTSDADINNAAKSIAFGKLLNSGQTCIAPDYILVDEKIKDQLYAKLDEQFKVMIGNSLDNDDYPRIINERHFNRLLKLMENTSIYSGGKSNKDTLKIEPTLITDVDINSPIMKEEIFGPLLPILTYKSIDEAEQYILKNEKPLSLYLFTNNKKIEKRIFNNLSFGGGCVNDTIVHIMCKGLSFGGVGSSGMGKYHGKYSFDTFTHKKGIYKKSLIFELPLRYQPYKDKFLKITKKILK